MNIRQDFGVTPSKVEELRKRLIRLKIDARQIEESFIRGKGPGGQKINKTSSAVVLRYAPLDLTVRCQKDRKQSTNRFLALRELVDRIEMTASPATFNRLRKIEHQQASKARSHRKAKARHRGVEEE